MNPDDIPTSVTQLVYTAPEIGGPATGIHSVSQNDMAKLLAHFWPAIEQHIREQVAQQLYDQNPDRDADFTAGVDWAIDTIRNPR